MDELKEKIETKIMTLADAINSEEQPMSYDEQKQSIDLMNCYLTLLERIKA